MIQPLRRATAMIGLLSAVAAPMPAQSGPAGLQCHGKPATVVGTPGKDKLRTSDYRAGDVILLLGGDDKVTRIEVARLTVCGGAGDDELTFDQSGGHHFVRDSLLDGGKGDDLLGDVGDVEFPVAESLRLIGGPGADELVGGGDKDVLKGGGGDDGAFGFGGADLIAGQAGDDRLKGYQENDTLRGGPGDDRIKGDGYEYFPPAPNDLAIGGAGTDHCEAERTRSCER